ncbi:MAG: hypothetical protein R3F46_12315 [bacterium]
MNPVKPQYTVDSGRSMSVAELWRRHCLQIAVLYISFTDEFVGDDAA